MYVAAALGELLGYAGLESRVEGVAGVDPARWSRRLLLVFSNGKEFGGAFRIAPGARIDDGALDAVVCGDGIRLARLPLLARAIRGTHLTHPMVRHTAAARFSLAFREPTHFEADGELRRTIGAEAEVACLPSALRVLDAASG